PTVSLMVATGPGRDHGQGCPTPSAPLVGGIRMTRIGVLTGGGDVPGLNPCIKTLVYAAVGRGYEVVGLRRGWAGLLDYNLDDDRSQDQCVQPLGKREVRT